MNGRQTQGAALRPLSGKQIRSLVLLARSAYSRGDRSEDFDTWRRRETLLAVERGGLRQCRNEDFLPLRAHFMEMLGNGRQADADRLRHQVEPRTWALAKLSQELKAAQDVVENPRAYVVSIARSKFKTGLIETDLAENQIWQLVYSIRNAAARRRKQSEEVPF